MMKNLFRKQEFHLDEIIFERRNKEYGAYVLRNEADQILTKSMFLGIGLFAAVALTPLIVNSVNKGAPAIPDDGPGPVWVDPPVTDDAPVQPPTVVPPKQVKTFDSTVPEPTADPKIEKPAASIDKYDDAASGTQDVEGETPTVGYHPPVVGSTVNPGPPVVPVPEPKIENPNAIVQDVDVEAVFHGGIEIFRSKVVNNFDTSGFDGSGETLRTTVTFVVEKDGTISNIKATGTDASFNREAERTIKNVKGKWMPAKVNGKPVRSYFKFPVTMKFE